ncbi:hypothetical protein GE09DRAFT_1264803 [Coniochaeta sp. 2T2.1]|nr:hypothetical protein GE09DRAFT_1264803 [Coniochaeta sp. 2T2.1]
MTEKADNDNPNTDLAHRRERGRLAQRAFRQRQIDTIRALNDENQELKDAIDRIARASAFIRPGSDESDLVAAVQHARHVARLDVAIEDHRNRRSSSGGGGYHSSDDAESNAQNLRLSLRQSRPSASSTSTTSTGPITVDPSIITGPHNHHWGGLSTSHSSDDTSLEELLDWPQPSPQPISSSHSYPTHPSLATHAAPSPRLTYGLLFNHQQAPPPPPPSSLPYSSSTSSSRTRRVTSPPPDITAYLGPASQTFSGTLFWSALSYAYHAVRAAIRLPPPSTPTPSGGETITNIHLQVTPTHPSEDAHNVFASVLQYTTLGQLHDLLHARLLFRRQGWVPADHPAARDPEAWIRLHACILQHENVDIDNWWAPIDIEAYVRSRMLEDGGGLGGFGDPRVVFKTLVPKGRCFGDGPRWSAELVREVVDGTRWGEGMAFS